MDILVILFLTQEEPKAEDKTVQQEVSQDSLKFELDVNQMILFGIIFIIFCFIYLCYEVCKIILSKAFLGIFFVKKWT